MFVKTQLRGQSYFDHSLTPFDLNKSSPGPQFATCVCLQRRSTGTEMCYAHGSVPRRICVTQPYRRLCATATRSTATLSPGLKVRVTRSRSRKRRSCIHGYDGSKQVLCQGFTQKAAELRASTNADAAHDVAQKTYC